VRNALAGEDAAARSRAAMWLTRAGYVGRTATRGCPPTYSARAAARWTLR